MSRRHRFAVFPLPRSLTALVRAAERECSAAHGMALRALGDLAARKVPSRGVLWSAGDAVEEDLHVRIRLIAERHLGAAKVEAEWRRSLDRMAAKITENERSVLEDAHLGAKWISRTAHFYTGLAFGVTFTDWRL